jgi:carbamoyl-phosphate synthase small subunit
MKKALLMLEDGAVFEGVSFGAEGETFGTAVFNTSVSGYQEILTNPSSRGQVISITYPEIGAYGVNYEDVESPMIQASGLIVKRACTYESNWRARGRLPDYLKKNKIIGVENLDTRALLRHLKKSGEQKCVLTTKPGTKAALLKKLKAAVNPVETDLVADVTTKEKYIWDATKKITGLGLFAKEETYLKISDNKQKFKVAVIDCGIKYAFLQMLSSANCAATVFPASVKAEELFDGFNGVMISNGPGDPSVPGYITSEIKKLLGKIPVMGIDIGCLLLAIALGGKTHKMKAGHRGGNHSIKNLETGAVEVAAQNHGYAVDAASLKKAGVKVTHINLNDNSVEGIAAPEQKVFGVQYYPQARPGAHDAPYVFNKFIDLMKSKKGAK